MGIVFSRDDCHKIHLLFHHTLCCLYKIPILMLIRIKPPDKKTISKDLFLVTCLSNVEHYIIILFKELFNNSNKCLFEFWIQW